MADAVVQMRNVRYAWPRQPEPCLAIDALDVRRGERVFIFGPSGSGKSTLLGLLGGVLVPQHGEVSVLGTALNRLRPAMRDAFRAQHVGFLFQLFNLIPYLSVIDNVVLPCHFSPARRRRSLAGGASLREEAMRLLAHLDIGGSLVSRPVTELSVGQQQRVAAARALLGRPEIVVADEPTSALDADRQKAFLDLLLAECGGAGSTLLFVSHDRRLSAAFDRDIDLAALNRAYRAGAPA